jgi:hypothetical protein
MRTAIERVTPAEARTDAQSPIVAIDRTSEGDEATIDEDALIVKGAMVVQACMDIAGNNAAGVEVRAAAVASGGIRWRQHGEADGGGGSDCKQCRMFEHGELLVSPGLSMPTIGHRIQVDAVNGATVFQKGMPTQMQMRDNKKARLVIARRAWASCTIERLASVLPLHAAPQTH